MNNHTKENMWRNVIIHSNKNYQVSATCSNCNYTIKLNKLTELPSICPKCQADMRQIKKNKVIVPDDYVSRYELVKHLIGVLDGWRQPLKYSTIDEEIVAFPAADVAEVVRCKDCKFGKWNAVECRYWCQGHFRTPDWFCGDGERRTDNG